MALQIRLVCPVPAGSCQGNRITALRWARILRALGHRVRIDTGYDGAADDLLIALHARRSAGAVREFRARFPARPVVVALTGTDLYQDLERSRLAQRSLALADRLVLLQPAGLAALPPAVRPKARVIHQSAEQPCNGLRPAADRFDVCVLSHLRAVKDPFRAALAARLLPVRSRIRILHAGRALSPSLAARAHAEEARNARYRWLGELHHGQALALLARSRLLVLSSLLEGGANVIGESVRCRVPVLASRVDGTIGLLGPHYPGFFPPGDTEALAAQLVRAETDRAFYAQLRHAAVGRAALFSPARERRSWRRLLAELGA